MIEGAGSPAEINLKENDIVNMGLAELLDAPVLLVGDIDRGGVFAQLIGTLVLLEEKERERIKGLIINKFRGDVSILDPGIKMLEEKGGIPVTGVVPYMHLVLEDEDSLSDRFAEHEEKAVDIAVIRFPRISNFTDFMVFESIEGVSVRYVDTLEKLHHPDMIILPGSKNTMGDLKWMRQNGLEAAIKKHAQNRDAVIFGICGGYQMLGECITDPYGVEEGGMLRGMELLPLETEMEQEKTRTQVDGTFEELTGVLSVLSGVKLTGYEIHMGAMQISLSVGVAASVGLSMLRVLTGIPIMYFLIPGYAIALFLTLFVPKIFTAIAFDSGGVASGPMTATFLLPLAQGACTAVGGDVVKDAFGVVAMVAMTPLITLQVLGLIYKIKSNKKEEMAEQPFLQAEDVFAGYADDAIIEL